MRIAPRWKNQHHAEVAVPPDFRREVVAVALKDEAAISQFTKDFGISESCLHRWLNLADIEDGAPWRHSQGVRRGVGVESATRVLEQEVEMLRRAATDFAKDIAPLCTR